MNRVSFFILLLTLSYLTSYSQDSWFQTRASGNGNIQVYYHVNEPYFYEEEGQLKGTEYELFQAFIKFVEKRYSVKLKVQYTGINNYSEFYNTVKGASNGTFGLGSVSITEEGEKEIRFSASYLPDIDVLVSSNNLPIITDSSKIAQAFKAAKGLTVENTIYQDEMIVLKKRYPSLSVVFANHIEEVRNRLAKENNLFGFISLIDYLQMRLNKIRVKRQVLFNQQRIGKAMIHPLTSDWSEPLQTFFDSEAVDGILTDIYRKYFGDEIYELAISQQGDPSLLAIKEQEVREQELAEQTTQINTTQDQLKERNLILYAGLGLLALIAVLLFVFLSRYRSQKKSNVLLEQLNKQVEAQKTQVQRANTELKTLNDEIEQAKNALEGQNKKILDSIRAGKSIQKALLPFEDRLHSAFSDHFVIWNPKDVVSGDFYWLSQLGNTTFLAVVDCTGHGVPGAFVSMLGFALLNDIVNVQKIHEPNKILELLHNGIENALMQGDTDEKHGMDVCFCRIDQRSEEEFQLIYAGAKRPLYVFSNRKLGKLAGDRIGVGGGLLTVSDQELHFNNYGLTLNKGDVLYLTTDGYADTPNRERKKLGTSQMEEFFRRYAPFPMKWQQNKLLQNLEEFQEDVDPRDDVTIIGIKL